VPLNRAAHDQVRGHHQVAQFDQVVADPEVGVVLVDFARQQADAVQRALEALVGAHDADVVPHEATQFRPVVGDDHASSASVTRLSSHCGRSGRGADRAARMSLGRRAFAYTRHSSSELLARRLAPCRPVGRFADGVEPGHVGAGALIGDLHAAAGVVRSGHDRDRLPGDVDAQFQAAGVDVREVADQEFRPACATCRGRRSRGRASSSRSRWRGRRRHAARVRRGCRVPGMKRCRRAACSRPPSPRIASEIRKDLACGW
jgi:hypothetical protein